MHSSVINAVSLGGAVVDLRFEISSFPSFGQAAQAVDFNYEIGGKALNIAVGLAKQQANSILLAAIGKDIFGDYIIRSLSGFDVDTSVISTDRVSKSSVTGVFVNLDGDAAYLGWLPEDSIKGYLTAINELEARKSRIDILFITFEVPMIVIELALLKLVDANTLVVVNPSPRVSGIDFIPAKIVKTVDWLILNTGEAVSLVGDEKPGSLNYQTVATKLKIKGFKNICITDSNKGVFVSSDEDIFLSAYSVSQVDSTACGDAFCSTMGIEIAKGTGYKIAAERANAAGALAAMHPGAARSLPTKEEIDEFLNSSISKNR